MRNRVVAIQLLTTLAMLLGCAKQSADQFASDLEGDWVIVSMKGDGFEITPTELESMKWQVIGDTISATNPDGTTGKMRVQLDPGKKTIDITALDGNRKGETDQGIYSLDRAMLTICLAEPASRSARPTGFVANAESWIIELQRTQR